MKKTTKLAGKEKLQLNRETLRSLEEGKELQEVAGGLTNTTHHTCQITNCYKV